jgi:adenosylcobinamide-GDP ribazoletransferase
MVAVAWRMDYLRPQGAGTALLENNGGPNLLIASILAVAAMTFVWNLIALKSALTALALALLLRRFYRRWLGGVTGDLIGAAGEIIEAAVLIAASM